VFIDSPVDQEYLAHDGVHISNGVLRKLISYGGEVHPGLKALYFEWEALPLALHNLVGDIRYRGQLSQLVIIIRQIHIFYFLE
jgi:hypothetical protein